MEVHAFVVIIMGLASCFMAASLLHHAWVDRHCAARRKLYMAWVLVAMYGLGGVLMTLMGFGLIVLHNVAVNNVPMGVGF